MNPLRKKMVQVGLNQIGKPYIWGGHGYHLWTSDGLKDTTYGVAVYDCAGLVTTSLKDAGGPDWRISHNAQLLYNECEETGKTATSHTPPNFATDLGWLMFWGESLGRITHVGIHISEGMVLEASGGDRSTTTLDLAQKHGAKVRIGWNGRLDFQGYGLPKQLLDD